MARLPSKPIIQSAGGVVYYLKQGKPVYLLIKRQAKSKKIERVAPKGKIEPGETAESAALRESSEEAGLAHDRLTVRKYIGIVELRSSEEKYVHIEKDTKFYLMHYSGDPCSVKIIDGEGYTGMFVWATFSQAMTLIPYASMRELIRKAHKHCCVIHP